MGHGVRALLVYGPLALLAYAAPSLSLISSMSHHPDNDTFLSRIFGLNSVNYSQINENGYSNGYYDDNSIDLEANVPKSVHLNNLHLLNSDDESDSDSELGDSIDDLLISRSGTGERDSRIERSDSRGVTARAGRANGVESAGPAGAAGAVGGAAGAGVAGGDAAGAGPSTVPPIISNKSIKFSVPEKSIFNRKTRFNIPPKERALYLWANIVNMDDFLNDVYYYYQNRGLNNIVLSKLVDLFILAFILWFSVFLKWGINYDFFKEWDQATDEKIYLKHLVKPNYFLQVPFFIKFLLLGFWGYIILRLVQLYYNYKYKLKEIQNFYYQLIKIRNDDELLAISWLKVVKKIMLLKNYNNLTSSANQMMNVNDLNSKIRLNPHDIANRIMRKENYFIALINKRILDLTSQIGPIHLSNSNLLTKTLEWNLKLCIFNFIFNTNGQINSRILKDFNRNQLSLELNKRFKMAAIINLILSPFLVIYFVLLYFFKYFNEYRINPSSIINLRQFTPYAEWKLREFNELPHFFNKRLKLSHNPSNNYINQFPSSFLLVNLMYLINFLSGSFTAILVIGGLLLEDESHSFWSFELTEGKSVLFYISIFGTIFAVTSNSSDSQKPNSNNDPVSYYDPEASIKYVSQFTHYLPKHWKGKLHTQQVKNEYCELFKLRILIILNELLSILLTPFLLWFKISNFAGSIIDFFRDYSIHIDGLGYICYFSMFNFEENDKDMLNKKRNQKRRRNMMRKNSGDSLNSEIIGNNDNDDDTDNESDENDLFYQDDKMIKSYMYFLESYQPDKVNNHPERNAKVNNSVVNNRLNKRSLKMSSKLDQSVDPSSSIMADDFNDLMANSEVTVDKAGNSGVLGMLNQFYKQDINKA